MVKNLQAGLGFWFKGMFLMLYANRKFYISNMLPIKDYAVFIFNVDDL